jgi:hypothetical protein
MAKNAIRQFAVGRNTWLFAGTARGVNISPTYYPSIETAKANNLEKHRHCKYARENRGRIALECAAENYEDVGADLRALTFKK